MGVKLSGSIGGFRNRRDVQARRPVASGIFRHLQANPKKRGRCIAAPPNLREGKNRSRTISRVLFPGQAGAAIIPLGPELLPASSNLPEGFSRASLKRLPIWSCSGRGMPSSPRRRGDWWALTPPFHPYPRGQVRAGGLLSVALSRDRSRWGLPSVPPCGARTFLPEPCGSRRWPVRLPLLSMTGKLRCQSLPIKITQILKLLAGLIQPPRRNPFSRSA